MKYAYMIDDRTVMIMCIVMTAGMPGENWRSLMKIIEMNIVGICANAAVLA